MACQPPYGVRAEGAHDDERLDEQLKAIVRTPDERPVTNQVPDSLGPEEAARVLAIVYGSDPGAAVVVDVRSVSEFEDHVLVRIAQAVASRGTRGSFIGLPRHEERVLKYMGVSLGLP